ncbi:dTDP-4-dehydrorhamnose 3,5-epimerase [Salana multivorans]|uniref:dTDP-4-dehydrorhamnose 3,5-epimerase n=1 Tax=Salana multivorans TaxID=120377 RepID=A0A3N2D7G6_9MICO|nr:dTDP-4-dehydrorhamnose 3,5-epimerase [Salana multivorans]ROR95736.1 dTDP-4-dehydrorhamnose 3,5-epimerase [Salana multivorans]
MPPTTDSLAAEQSAIDGLLVLRTKEISDGRGTIREFFRSSTFGRTGVDIGPWRQINLTATRQGAVRGLHGEDMTKLVAVASGEAFGVYVDARPTSPTLGQVVTVPLVVGVQVLVPRGVCNGFQSISPGGSQYLYCFDEEWRPGMAGVAITPLDPSLDVAWPIPIDPGDRDQISEKDAAAPSFADALAALRSHEAHEHEDD